MTQEAKMSDNKRLIVEMDALVAEATGLRVFTQPSPCGDDFEFTAEGVRAWKLLAA